MQGFVTINVDEFISAVRQVIKDEIKEKNLQELQEKLLSPNEVCTMFQPNISRVTLDAWTKKGLLRKHVLGGRNYYRYSEILDSIQTIKRYQRH